jgi:hypothetical protein
MISGLRVLFLTPLAALLACAGQAPLTVPAAPAVSGDYVLNVTPSPANPATSVTGNLYISGSSAYGAFQYNDQNSACNGQSFPVAGNVAANGIVSLSSSSFAGTFLDNTATMTFLILQDAGEVPNSSGTIQITAGTGIDCALPNSALIANYVPPYSGTWGGEAVLPSTTIPSPGGYVTLSVNEALPGTPPQQASAASTTGGVIPVTGSIVFISATYPVCSFTNLFFTTKPVQLTGQISGYDLQLTASSYPITVQLNTSTNVNFSMTVAEPKPCGGTYSGILTQQ